MHPTPFSLPDNAAEATAGTPTVPEDQSSGPTATAQVVAHDDPNAMTVLIARDTGHGAPVMAKTWRQGSYGVECQHYDYASIFKAYTVLVPTLAALITTLGELKGISRACVIRGALRPHANPDCTPRWSCDQGDRQATFAECPRRWVLLDYDGFKTTDFPSPVTDPQACIEAIRQQLPEELREVGFFWSFSGSTGMKVGKLGVHLYLLLDTPLGWRDTEAFITACRADPAVSRIVQVHYTAAPVFVPPLTDPLPQRFGTLPGIERVPADVVADLVRQGHLDIAQTKVAQRVRQRARPTTPATAMKPRPMHAPKPTPPAEERADEPVPEGKIGDGHRHQHLLPMAGFLRRAGFDPEALNRALIAENTARCHPPLSAEKVERIVAAMQRYAPKPNKVVQATPWRKAVALIAGLHHRHDAADETLMVAAEILLGNRAQAARTVEGFLKLGFWARGCAEARPERFLDEGALS